MSFRARAEAKDMELVPTKEPASHLASRRYPGVLPNAKYRAEARTHYFVTKSAARVTPCGKGHSTLRSLAPQFQTKPASLGFCLVEGNERYGGKYAKKQAIQYKNLSTRLRDNPPKSGSAHMSQSDYVISCCLGKKIIILDGLKEVLRQQKANGNNLNQLAVLANMDKVQFANLDAAAREFAKLLLSVVSGKATSFAR